MQNANLQSSIYNYNKVIMINRADPLWAQIFYEIYDKAVDSIFIIDTYGRFIEVNPAYCSLTGYLSEELLKMSLSDVEAKEITADKRKLIKDMITSGKTGFETTYKRKDNTLVNVKINGFLLKFYNEPLMVIFVHELEAQKQEANFDQTQKMDIIAKFTGSMAHQLNNLLTVIQGYTDMALIQLPDNSNVHEYLKEVTQAAMQTANITHQLLLFGQTQPLNSKNIDLNSIISNLFKILNRLLDKRYSIFNELTEGLRTINADPAYMEQILINIVVNARDAMPEGGNITIKTENVYIDENYVKVYKYAHTGRFICLSVKDNGTGMDENTISRAFDPFFTTKEPADAIGLGLSVVYGLVRQHKGWINIESNPGEGSIFKLYFPAVYTEDKQNTIDEFQGNGERILLVEDETNVRMFTERVLRNKGYTVFSASNAKEAFNIFNKENGNFNLIFTDILLPDENGAKLAERLLALKPELPVLFASGYSEENIEETKKMRFLQKPYVLTDLLRVIKELAQIFDIK